MSGRGIRPVRDTSYSFKPIVEYDTYSAPGLGEEASSGSSSEEHSLFMQIESHKDFNVDEEEEWQVISGKNEDFDPIQNRAFRGESFSESVSV